MITYRLNTFGRKATKALQFHPQGIYLEAHDTAVLSWMISIGPPKMLSSFLLITVDIKTQNSNLQMWGAYMMTVPAAVLRIHLCGDPTDCSGHWRIQQRSQGRPISARWAPSDSVLHQSDWIPPGTGLHLRLSHLTLYFLLFSLWGQTKLTVSCSFGVHSYFSHSHSLSPSLQILAFPILSWHLPLEGSKLHAHKKWLKQVVRWRKRISSSVAGVSHSLWHKVVAQVPKISLLVTWGASWWSWNAIAAKMIQDPVRFRRYGEKDAYKDRLLLSWLTVCKGVRN